MYKPEKKLLRKSIYQRLSTKGGVTIVLKIQISHTHTQKVIHVLKYVLLKYCFTLKLFIIEVLLYLHYS